MTHGQSDSLPAPPRPADKGARRSHGGAGDGGAGDMAGKGPGPTHDGSGGRDGPPAPIGLVARLRAYFFAGVLITAPAAITFYVAWLVIDFIDRQVTPLLPPTYNPETYLPFGLPGLGLLILMAVLTAIGALTAGFVGRATVRVGERILARMPVIRSIYSATKQIFETVLRQQSTAFREVVLFEYPRRGIWTMGFITGVAHGEIQPLAGGDDTMINVFVPTTPNPTSGFLLFIPRRDLTRLSMTVEEGIKMVVSGGIVTPPHRAGAAPSGVADAALPVLEGLGADGILTAQPLPAAILPEGVPSPGLAPAAEPPVTRIAGS